MTVKLQSLSVTRGYLGEVRGNFDLIYVVYFCLDDLLTFIFESTLELDKKVCLVVSVGMLTKVSVLLWSKPDLWLWIKTKPNQTKSLIFILFHYK